MRAPGQPGFGATSTGPGQDARAYAEALGKLVGKYNINLPEIGGTYQYANTSTAGSFGVGGKAIYDEDHPGHTGEFGSGLSQVGPVYMDIDLGGDGGQGYYGGSGGIGGYGKNRGLGGNGGGGGSHFLNSKFTTENTYYNNFDTLLDRRHPNIPADQAITAIEQKVNDVYVHTEKMEYNGQNEETRMPYWFEFNENGVRTGIKDASGACLSFFFYERNSNGKYMVMVV